MRGRVAAIIGRRVAGLPVWVVLVQVFVGLGWVRAAVEKAIDPTWWNGQYLLDFLDEHAGEAVGWYQPFLDLVVAPGAISVSVVVVALQLAVGVLLLTGRRVVPALTLGVVMNLHFVAAGAVTPSVFYLLAQGAVLLWLAERARHEALRTVRRVAVIGLAVGLASAPFIGTLHPAEVIDDPAVMLVTAGVLTVLTAELLHRRSSIGAGLP